MNESQIKHARACVRMKMKVDQRNLRTRVNRMTLEQQDNTHRRIQRGLDTTAALERLLEQLGCTHNGATYASNSGVVLCCNCGGRVPTTTGDHGNGED